jgi:hypothetical protein
METAQIESNPFALMVDPEAVLAAVARSERLATLKSRICRPLDKPVIARTDDEPETPAIVFDDLMDSFGVPTEA